MLYHKKAILTYPRLVVCRNTGVPGMFIFSGTSCLTAPLLLSRVTCGTGTMMLCAPALVTVGIWCDRSTFGGCELSPIWGPEKHQ